MHLAVAGHPACWQPRRLVYRCGPAHRSHFRFPVSVGWKFNDTKHATAGRRGNEQRNPARVCGRKVTVVRREGMRLPEISHRVGGCLKYRHDMRRSPVGNKHRLAPIIMTRNDETVLPDVRAGRHRRADFRRFHFDPPSTDATRVVARGREPHGMAQEFGPTLKARFRPRAARLILSFV